MLIRPAVDADWPRIFPIFAAIVSAWEIYAYPDGLDQAAARSWWMALPPGATAVAVDADVVLGSATMGPNRPSRGAHVPTAGVMVDPDRHGERRRAGPG